LKSSASLPLYYVVLEFPPGIQALGGFFEIIGLRIFLFCSCRDRMGKARGVSYFEWFVDKICELNLWEITRSDPSFGKRPGVVLLFDIIRFDCKELKRYVLI